MHVSLVWPDCTFHNYRWGQQAMDAFWVCTGDVNVAQYLLAQRTDTEIAEMTAARPAALELIKRHQAEEVSDAVTTLLETAPPGWGSAIFVPPNHQEPWLFCFLIARD